MEHEDRFLDKTRQGKKQNKRHSTRHGRKKEQLR